MRLGKSEYLRGKSVNAAVVRANVIMQLTVFRGHVSHTERTFHCPSATLEVLQENGVPFLEDILRTFAQVRLRRFRGVSHVRNMLESEMYADSLSYKNKENH